MNQKLWLALSLLLVALGCSTVQVAQLDTTRPPTHKIDFFRSTPVMDRKYTEIAYLAYGGVTERNMTAALGRLMERARQLGADALILQDSPEGTTNMLHAVAVAYQAP